MSLLEGNSGYRVNIRLYPFLRERLLAAISQVSGFSILDAGFECSVPGLHFLGAPAVWSFGSLVRFVAGADFASLGVEAEGVNGNGQRSLTREKYPHLFSQWQPT